jgi:hypothetical protein
MVEERISNTQVSTHPSAGLKSVMLLCGSRDKRESYTSNCLLNMESTRALDNEKSSPIACQRISSANPLQGLLHGLYFI